MKKNFEEYDDAELFQLLRKDKRTAERAFAELYNRYSSKVYAFCRRFLGNTEEAQDVFQETFIRFHNSAESDREMTNVPAFLLTIARNLCVNLKRKERNDVSFEDYMVADFDEQSDRKELLKIINNAIELLPDDYKEMFILREYDGLSYNEIAKVTGENINNVKVRLHRAKVKIREILQPYFDEMKRFEKKNN